MIRFIQQFAVTTAFALIPALSLSQVTSLEVDGATVATGDEIAAVQFDTLTGTPGAFALRIDSIFQDLRCVTSSGQELLTSGNTTLVLDQVNPNEADAEYSIAAPTSGGAVQYVAATGELIVSTTDIAGQRLVCDRFRSTFWGSDFENAFSVSAATPASPFPVDNTLTIPVTLTNDTLSEVASDVLMDFEWSATDDGGLNVPTVPAPTFSPGVDVTSLPGGGFRWDVGILWPGESRTIDVNYALGPDVPVDTLITTEVVNVEASDREGLAPLPVLAGLPFVSEVVTGEASLTIEKTQTAGPAPVTQVGQQIDYEVVIENTGTFALTGVTVQDTFPNGNVTTLTNPVESLTPDGLFEPGETWTYSTSYTVEQDDIDAGGSIVNTASVETVEFPGPAVDTAETVVSGTASVQIDKTQTDAPTDASFAGQLIPYEIELFNDGTLTLTNVEVRDTYPDGIVELLGSPLESMTPDSRLEVGETWTYATSYEVTQTDLDTKSFLTNTARVDADQLTGSSSDTATTLVSGTDSVTITKTQDDAPAAATAAGQLIEYTVVVENDGTLTQSGVAVEDTLPDGSIIQLTDPVESGSNDNILSVGETWTYSTSYTVTQGDMDAGDDLVNSVEVTTDQLPSADDPSQQDSAVTTVAALAELTADEARVVQNAVYFDVNDVIGYELDVTNTGNVTISGPLTVAGGVANISCPLAGGTLDVAETVTCTGDHTVSQADLNAGEVMKNVSASASAGAIVSNGLDASAIAAISISKVLFDYDDLDESGSVSQGDRLTYRITVGNESASDLNNVEVDDPMISPDSEQCTIVIPGSSCVLQGNYTVTANDAGTTLTNTATGTATETGTVTTSLDTVVD